MDTHPKPLEGSKLKLERAKEHIQQLEAEINSFPKRKPYHIVVDKDRQSRDWFYRIKCKEQPPLRWATIIGDIVHNLRSALDLLINDLVKVNGGTPDENPAFPINQNARAFEDRFSGKVCGASKEAIGIIRSLTP